MKYREQCQQLGATAYFEKPIDFKKLKDSLLKQLQTPRSERRAHVRVRMHIGLRLRGTDAAGKTIDELTATENASAGGFLCNCIASLVQGAVVEVFLSSGTERFVGKARVVRREAPGAPWQRYGFQFVEKNSEWVLQ